MKRDVFQGIADPTRREIIHLLAQGKPMNLNSIADQFPISRPAISKHIKILEECKLIDIQQEGRQRICELKPESLVTVSDWVEKNRKLWNKRLDRLENHLKTMEDNNE